MSWSDDKELLSGADAIGWNSLKKNWYLWCNPTFDSNLKNKKKIKKKILSLKINNLWHMIQNWTLIIKFN